MYVRYYRVYWVADASLAADHMAQRSLDAHITAGAAADACRYRFKALPDTGGRLGGRDHFALAVAAYCAAELGGRSVPKLRWFASAGVGEKAAYGSDSCSFDGFMEPGTGDIWIRDDVPNHALVEVVAHETCHAVKHRGRKVSLDMEREAIDFGRRIAAKWNVLQRAGAKLFVVKTMRELPLRAWPESTALCVADMALYLATGTHDTPRWRAYCRFDDASNEDRTPTGASHCFVSKY